MQPFPAPTANCLLATLPPGVLRQLERDLEPVPLEVGQVLVARNAAPEWVYFPTSGLASRLLARGKGSGTEVGAFGRDGMSSLGLVFGDRVSPSESVVQLAGAGWRMSARRFLRHHQRQPALRSIAQRYTEVVLLQLAWQILCTSSHSVPQRLACWLLRALACTGQDTFALTHDTLAQLLGVRRASVTIAATELRGAGVIAYRRGTITVLDRSGLKQACCECWDEAADAYERIIGAMAA